MPCYSALTHKDSQISKFSVSSDRNIRDHLWRWSTYFGCFTYVIRKKNKKRLESDSSWLAWFSSEDAGHSIFLGYLTGRFGVMEHPAIINTKLGHYAHFWIFRRESFGARKKRLAARRSGSRARKIVSSACSTTPLKLTLFGLNRSIISIPSRGLVTRPHISTTKAHAFGDP